jgi:hypothetical protein
VIASVTFLVLFNYAGRVLQNDARKEADWADVHKMMDVVQPWTVGRYKDTASTDRWKEDMLTPDLALAARNYQIYMPVIFLGFVA